MSDDLNLPTYVKWANEMENLMFDFNEGLEKGGYSREEISNITKQSIALHLASYLMNADTVMQMIDETADLSSMAVKMAIEIKEKTEGD